LGFSALEPPIVEGWSGEDGKLINLNNVKNIYLLKFQQNHL